MPSLPNIIRPLVEPYWSAARWLVAYSGGVDSLVLLHLLASYSDRPPVFAVHINHQLQTQADSWARHCQQQADALAVPIIITPVDIECGSRESLEDKARKARYQVFEALLEPGDVLWMGHHLDDQVETLMLRLLRGSGSRGNAAMPAHRPLGAGQLVRPLLETPRLAIEDYAKEHALSWVEDPSNLNQHYDRNFLRQSLLPQLAQHWPEYRQTLSRAALLNQEAAQLNQELAELDLQQLGITRFDLSIAISSLAELSLARQKNLLRSWLQLRGLNLPTAAQLQAVIDEVIEARADAEPLLCWPGVEVRRFKDQLYAISPLPVFNPAASYRWSADKIITIDGVGQFSTEPGSGQGINPALLAGKHCELRFRAGGERCQPAGRHHSQTLKKLLQEFNIETWWRDRLPLLYCDGELVAVADLWVCEGWAAKTNEPGLILKLDKIQ